MHGLNSTSQATGVVYNENATPVRIVDYTYDPVGNRTQVVDNAVTTPYTANNLNQYTAIDSLPAPSYDANGNLSGIRYSVSGLDWAYSYDAQNRFVSASASDSSVSAAITYDARNRQVSRTINGQTIYFIWDDWSLIEERDSSGTLLAKYVHGPVIDEILGKIDSTGTVYYHHDGLGSTIALTNSAGTVVESYSYDVFGTPQAYDQSAIPIPQSAIANRFLFTGREWIQQVSFYDYRNRAYSTELGRFLQTDPLRLAGRDFNVYRFVKNGAVGRLDPTGLAWQEGEITMTGKWAHQDTLFNIVDANLSGLTLWIMFDPNMNIQIVYAASADVECTCDINGDTKTVSGTRIKHVQAHLNSVDNPFPAASGSRIPGAGTLTRKILQNEATKQGKAMLKGMAKELNRRVKEKRPDDSDTGDGWKGGASPCNSSTEGQK